MPYIKKAQRQALDYCHVDTVGKRCIDNAGQLNYVITKIIRGYIMQKGMSYETLNTIIGVLDSAKLEFYRRTVAPYENKKIDENGDVY